MANAISIKLSKSAIAWLTAAALVATYLAPFAVHNAGAQAPQCGDPALDFAGGTSNILGAGVAGNKIGQFNNPVDAVVDSAGNIFVADSGNARIHEFDSAGNPVNSFGGGTINFFGGIGTGTGQFSQLSGMHVDASGNIYAVDSGRLQKFDSAGNPVNSFAGGTSNAISLGTSVRRVFVDASGNIYVSGYYSAAPPTVDFVRKFDSAGNPVNSFDGGTSNQLTIPETGGTGGGSAAAAEGVYVDAAGNIYVTLPRHHGVKKFDSAGNPVNSFAGGTSNKLGSLGTSAGQFINPYDAVVDAAGDIYVVDVRHRMQKFNDDGSLALDFAGGTSNTLGIPGSAGSAVGQFSNPYGVWVDAQGGIYVVDRGNHRIQKFFCTPPVPPVVDSDSDGVNDDVDACPGTPGTESRQGCPVGNVMTFTLQKIGHGPSSVSLVEGVEIRVFDRNDPGLVATYGSGVGNGDNFAEIYEGGVGQVGSCVTNADGTCTAGKEAVGDYLVIGKYEDTNESPFNIVYLGKAEDADDFIADETGGGAEGYVDLKLIKKYNKNGFDRYLPDGLVDNNAGGSAGALQYLPLLALAALGLAIYVKPRKKA
ncbi:MAG TPA: hypothetical protein VD862_04700 [Candidatus Paceibacterota bacterium]|nr:hypothetical protein [Candidatus Paceibacterota bacterium]